MANEQKQYEYVLPVGTVLISKKQRYTIEQVVNGKPLRAGQKIKSGDTVAPVLGQGGFGITYLASRKIKDENIDFSVYYAIKEFFVKGSCYREKGNSLMLYSPAATADVKENLKEFKDEARQLREICKGNPNIVNVNEVFEANGTAYYVMEFLEGESLRSLVRRTGPLSEGMALSLIRPIAEAVRYIHTRYNLLHLDIKPDNIMLRQTPDGQQIVPVLIDFGVSVHFDKKGDLTTTHNSTGTSKGYVPQEQHAGITQIVENRKRAQKDGFTHLPLIPCEVDVYALGATLYYMLVGTNPYDAFSMTPDIVQDKLPQAISEKTRQVVIGAMQPNYRVRTQTAAEFLKGFEDRYTLPKGFVLHSPHANYLITDVQDELDCCIRYGAVLYTGNAQQQPSSSGSTTRAQRYIVFERFNKSMYKRQKDESVSSMETSRDWWDREKAGFYSICMKYTGLKEPNESDTDGITVIREIFHANGTDYAVVKQGWRPWPQPNIIEKIKKAIAYYLSLLNGKARPLGIVACVALIGYGTYHFIGSWSEHREEERAKNKQLSEMLTEAIAKNNKAALEEFAKKDSTRAYLPLANIYMEENDTAQARKYADLAVRTGDESGKEIISKIEAMASKSTETKSSKKTEDKKSATSTKTVSSNSGSQSQREKQKRQEQEERRKKEAREQAEAEAIYQKLINPE